VTDNECHQASRELTAALAERCQTDTVTRGSIWIFLDELAENVLHHAESELGGFAAAQGWPRRRGEMEVAIVDLGQGIKASLTNNPVYADIPDDVTAIQRALEPNVTATPDRNSGLGLAVTRLALGGNGGTLVVRSGLGGVYSGARDDAGSRDFDLPGTLVPSQPEQISRWMFALSTASSGSTTVLRPSDELGSVLTGRSIGAELRERILAALEAGDVVEVDFEGVEVMSPSFADELFGKLPPEVLASGRVKFENLADDLTFLARFVAAQRARSA
jgi:anti-sigma regulatory factor (Ser/Thr protein kinase)